MSPASLRINSLVLFFFLLLCVTPAPAACKGAHASLNKLQALFILLDRGGKKPQSPSGLNNEEQKAPAQCRTKGHSCTGSYPESQSSPGGWVSGPLQGLL